ncbi:MAG: transglutaminase family protein [Planctomycetes bacterium]|nr:transglutaminase family protein [Planctomycetota bacterium]
MTGFPSDPLTTASGAAVGAARRRDAARARLESLVCLLEDEGPAIQAVAASNLRAARRAAAPALRRASRAASAAGRVRARALLADLERAPVVRRIAGYLTRDCVDLERGLFLLARLSAPDFDPRPSQRQLDELAREVAQRARARTDPLQRAIALVEVLGVEHGFQGAPEEFHRADRVHLDRVLATRRGIPLTLCAVYAAVAARAGLRVGLLPLPGHVLLRLFGDSTSLIVDPYHRGEVRSEGDLKRQLQARGHGFQPVWFRDADARTLLRRQVANLARSAELYGRRGEFAALRSILTALEPRRATSATAS